MLHVASFLTKNKVFKLYQKSALLVKSLKKGMLSCQNFGHKNSVNTFARLFSAFRAAIVEPGPLTSEKEPLVSFYSFSSYYFLLVFFDFLLPSKHGRLSSQADYFSRHLLSIYRDCLIGSFNTVVSIGSEKSMKDNVPVCSHKLIKFVHVHIII